MTALRTLLGFTLGQSLPKSLPQSMAVMCKHSQFTIPDNTFRVTGPPNPLSAPTPITNFARKVLRSPRTACITGFCTEAISWEAGLRKCTCAHYLFTKIQYPIIATPEAGWNEVINLGVWIVINIRVSQIRAPQAFIPC